ncbi:UDP-Glc:alpha-D-GlcNAc-diphosphoundecaprenol beta-1,3-glucosyltransferase WfgD [Abditibacteriota bacterium]|nr:UDP-Glc:alpha-D-GlcNAc-diphosphoundecaprenol beta-1,3-glucosyltransferase WfgD [Abditibacteriota bacterium]
MTGTNLETDFSISTIIPVYNGERYLTEAIESVLGQTYAPFEVIVVDDGSSDASASIAQSFGPVVRFIQQVNSGAAAARNQGVALTTGTHLAFLDADDVWKPAKLARQMQTLRENPALDIVFGGMEQFVSPELDEGIKSTIHCPIETIAGYTHCTMLIKRDSFQRVGPFPVGWQVGEFIDWFLHAQDKGLQSEMLPEVVMRRRLHPNNQGREKCDFRQDYVRIVKASMDRRRKQLN